MVNETWEDVWFDNFRIESTPPLIVQETHYDPWGLELTGLGYQYAGIKVNKYLYQGKELQNELGVDIYDFEARGYDAITGRTWQLDPASNLFYDLSPYSWVKNNPIRMIDPTGMVAGDFFDRLGNHLGTDGIEDGKVYVLNGNPSNDCTVQVCDGKLSQQSAEQLKANSTEITMDSDLGYMIRTVYAEMRGGDDNAKSIVAESIKNRSEMKVGSYENPDGTYKSIVNKAYDVTKEKDGANSTFKDPKSEIYKNSKEKAAWVSSVSASIKADEGLSNVGQGVQFYNSASSTIYDKNPKMEKITLDVTHKGVKGLWKLKK